jgi:hypothetical protein
MTRAATGFWGAPGIVVGATLVGGCVGGRDAATASDGASETGAASTDAGTSTTGEGLPTTSSSVGSSGEQVSGFIVALDGGTIENCDPFAQDCEVGEKCAAWAADGGTAWTATRCVPVTGDQKPGEPCTVVESAVSGLDDCVKGAMCWWVDLEGEGECVALCTGSARIPICEDVQLGCGATYCSMINEGVLNLCLHSCDPLAQDCPGDDVCVPVDGDFRCLLEGSGEVGAVFDPCEYANACDRGLLCAEPTAASECDPEASGCCVPMCSIAAGDELCPGVGQKCVPVYDPPTSGCEDFGHCSLVP